LQAVPYPLLKRLTDKAVSAALIVLLSPVFAVIWLAAVLDMLLSPGDRGPLLYRERRVSRGREFDLLKLRALREDALREMRDRGGWARQYEANPDNLTWVGRHLLKPWYLDELPQLVNVLLGDMSLVGPRPWPVAAVDEQVRQGHDYRTRALAGLTGPSQVEKGGPETGPGLDLAYLEACRRWSSWHLVGYDLALLLRSLRVMVRRDGLRN
jgi:lipopolysaccharide/colanic/teichoic acid biosynthesis glycosyltransferase